MDKKYQIFVSSTYKDLIEVRRDIARSILSLTEIPAAMEDFGAIDQKAMAYIKSVIDKYDYYVIIIAGRYGTWDESGTSYTEQEYDYAVEKKKVILAFLIEDIADLPAKDIDLGKKAQEKLKKFRDKVKDGRLVKFWTNPSELQTFVVVALTKAFRTHPAIGWIRGDQLEKFEKYKTNYERISIENTYLKYEKQNLLDEIERLKREADDGFSQEELEELFEFCEIPVYWHVGRKEYNHIISLQWIDVFKIVAPLIKRYAYTDKVRDKFSSIIIYQLGNRFDVITPPTIKTEFLEEVETFFMGLDLVDLTTNDLLRLTRKGVKLLLSLRKS